MCEYQAPQIKKEKKGKSIAQAQSRNITSPPKKQKKTTTKNKQQQQNTTHNLKSTLET